MKYFTRCISTRHVATQSLKSSFQRRPQVCTTASMRPKLNTLVDAGPKTEVPDYTEYDRSPLNKLLMKVFRETLKTVSNGEDSEHEGFDGIIDLTRRLNDTRLYTTEETKQKAIEVLRSLFPAWFTTAVAICISRLFPAVSARLNAWTTSVTCTWLMGPMEVNDIELDDATSARRQGVMIERCRFLEQSACASICQNSCKLPTQEFFKDNMGIDLSIEPNYEDFSCQFSFGKRPHPESEDPVLQTPCFLQCPTKKRYAASCQNVTTS